VATADDVVWLCLYVPIGRFRPFRPAAVAGAKYEFAGSEEGTCASQIGLHVTTWFIGMRLKSGAAGREASMVWGWPSHTHGDGGL
jgi:hypothetical protein